MTEHIQSEQSADDSNIKEVKILNEKKTNLILDDHHLKQEKLHKQEDESIKKVLESLEK